jgi:serine/threonine protein kinase
MDLSGDLKDAFADIDKQLPRPDAETIETAIEERLDQGRPLDPEALQSWSANHSTDADALLDLIRLDPPPNISVVKRMSQVGSQKVVYEALWRGLRPIVLKRFIGEGAERQRELLERELLPHPLTMAHPNIIETHVFKNDQGESFLVEKKLAIVLDDTWRAGGVAEASNLLYDLAIALFHLQSRDLVHGDLKPDNIGFEQGRFVLLDFGVCRKCQDFTAPDSATGSLRTRAPELLTGVAQASFSTDIFALGAVVFNSLVHAFPFFEPGEKIPRVSAAEERSAKEGEISERTEDRYEELVTDRLQTGVPHEALRNILTAALAKDPGERPTAGELAAIARTSLAAFVLNGDDHAALLPGEQLDQLDIYLPEQGLEEISPPRRLMDLQSSLEDFKFTDLSPTRAEQLTKLRRRAGLE